MNSRTFILAALIASVPATYGLGYSKGKGLCNSRNIVNAFRDVAQGALMNTPLVGDVYQRGLETGLEASCWETRGGALIMTGDAKLLSLEPPKYMK